MTEQNQLSQEQIDNEVRIIKEIAAKEQNIDDLKFVFSCIDLTTLNVTDNETHVNEFASKVNTFIDMYPDLDPVAAVCVYPNLVSSLEEALDLSQVRIASVAGGFPTSMTFTELKISEARMAVEAGADEIDIVLPVGAFLDRKYDFVHEEIAQIKKAIGEVTLKVILETGALDSLQNVWNASLLAMNAGADFIKTSTGKIEPAATLEASLIMCKAIQYHFEYTGERIGFKAAGGIVTSQQALEYLTLVREVLGEEWLTPAKFRIGASRLANNLLSDIFGREIKHF
ncbi:MAG: deoxyribose-phosphate aldolase [Bacteroidota bacterium]|nr:deoxyribose-phosphate aldolase [Bacteroidota bacterium]